MRKNKWKKHNSTAITSGYMATVIVTARAAVIINISASASCDQTSERIGRAKRQLQRLENDCIRESAHCEALKTPSGIDAALRKFHLAMRPANPDQNVRMNKMGVPVLGQTSVAQARKRVQERTAAYKVRSR